MAIDREKEGGARRGNTQRHMHRQKLPWLQQSGHVTQVAWAAINQ